MSSSSSSPHASSSSSGSTPVSAPTESAAAGSARDRDRYASTGDDQDDQHDQYDQHAQHNHSHLGAHGHGHGSLQPRPILKSERNLSRSSAHLRWDEDTIKLHDTERGTRMKIDEPKTPWTRADHSLEQINAAGSADGGGIPPLDLLDAMDVDPKEMVPSVVKDREAAKDEWCDEEEESEAEELDEEALEHKRQFEKMRSQHYNMKEALQRAKWLVEHEDAQEDDDDDDDEEESDSEVQIRVPPVPPLPSSIQKQ